MLMVCVAATTALYPLIIKWIFHLYDQRAQASMDVLGVQLRPEQVVWLIPPVVVGVTLIKGVSLYLQTLQTSGIVFGIIRDLQSAMFRHLVGADLARLTRDTTGSFISRFIGDVNVVREALNRTLNNMIRELLTVIGLLATMIWLDWILSLIVLVLYPLAAIPISALGRRMRKISANGSPVSHLRIGNQFGNIAEDGKMFFKNLRMFYLCFPRKSTDFYKAFFFFNIGKARDAIDIDEVFRRCKTKLHHRNQAMTAGKNLCVFTVFL